MISPGPELALAAQLIGSCRIANELLATYGRKRIRDQSGLELALQMGVQGSKFDGGDCYTIKNVLPFDSK